MTTGNMSKLELCHEIMKHQDTRKGSFSYPLISMVKYKRLKHWDSNSMSGKSLFSKFSKFGLTMTISYLNFFWRQSLVYHIQI